MSAEENLEDQINELEEAYKLGSIRVGVDIESKRYGVTFAVPAGWPLTLVDEEGAVLATATQIAGVIAQAIVQHYAPQLIPEGTDLVPSTDADDEANAEPTG